MINPYTGKSFFGFFLTFVKRALGAFQGQLAQDEIQIFVLFFIALSSSCIGTFLVLRKMTMLANSLSHTVLIGIIGSFVIMGRSEFFSQSIGSLLIGGGIAAICTTCGTEFLHNKLHLQKDASIGIIFTSLFALGVVLATTLTRSSHLGIEAIMGNIDALHSTDLSLVFYLFLFNIVILLIFYREFTILSFDSSLARNFGISIFCFNYLMMFQLAFTAMSAFRAVGAFLFLTFLVAPVLTARIFTKKLFPLIALSCGIGVLGSFIAVALTRHLLSTYQIALSTSGVVSVILGLFFFIGLVHKRRAFK